MTRGVASRPEVDEFDYVQVIRVIGRRENPSKVLVWCKRLRMKPGDGGRENSRDTPDLGRPRASGDWSQVVGSVVGEVEAL